MVPVNEHTLEVIVGVRLEDDPDAGRWSNISLSAETDGSAIVRLPLDSTDLAPGRYFAIIFLGGEVVPEDESEYTSDRGGVPYILKWWADFEAPQRRCLTDILAPTFEVVEDSPDGLQ